MDVSAANDLAVRYMPFAYKLASSIHRAIRGTDRDELEGDAMLGLVKASRGFDPDRGVGFACYAAKFILGAIKDGLRKSGREDESKILPDIVDNRVAPPDLAAEIADEVEHVRSRISTRRYGRGEMSGVEVGKSLGISQQAGSARVCRARELLKEIDAERIGAQRMIEKASCN